MAEPILSSSTSIAPAEVLRLADIWFGDLVELVVDLGARRIALGGVLHADAEERVLDAGGRQEDLGIRGQHP